MTRLRNFYRAFLIALLAAIPAFLCVFHQPSDGDRTAPDLPTNWVVPGIENAHQARAGRLFWAGVLSSQGQVALDPLKSPDLFSKLFPGYPDEMRLDQSLWTDYFSREFDTKVMSDALSTGSLYGNTIYYPWIGCLDIFRRYGADVVVFGASDVAQALPPDLLARAISKKLPSLQNPRVLTCYGAAGVPEGFGEMAKEMIGNAEHVGRPKWVIYGYSATSAYVDSVYYESAALAKVAALSSYRRNIALGSFSRWNHPVLFPWTWNNIIRLGQVPSHLPFMLAVKKRDPAAHFGRWSVLPQVITRNYVRDQASLKLLLSVEPFRNPLLLGNTLTACDWVSGSTEKIDEAIKVFRQLAPHVLLYLSPTTGDDLKVAPPCYEPSIKAMLEKQRSGCVRVKIDDSLAYGLSYEDFIFGESEEGPLWIDAIHPNIHGSRKITEALVTAMGND